MGSELGNNLVASFDIDWDEDELFKDDSLLTLSDDVPEEPISSHMYKFGDLRIDFPYPAYDSQIQLMQKAIEAVRSRQHALLESPTGTGKTAALLCSLLGWLKQENEKSELLDFSDADMDQFMATLPADWDPETSMQDLPTQKMGNAQTGEELSFLESSSLNRSFNASRNPRNDSDDEVKIYYATRTHSQIKQVVGQLRRTKYSNSVPVAILGSRKQFCINEDALATDSVDEYCTKCVDNYHWNNRNVEKIEKNADEMKTPVCSFYVPKDSCEASFAHIRGPVDIEDIRKVGRECGKCPYYGSKALIERARLILCTYNHLLHGGIRKALGIKVDGNIIVFDEAHNIENMCREMASCHITLDKLEMLKAYFAELREPDRHGNTKIPPSKEPYLTTLEVAVFRLSYWMRKQCEADCPGFTVSFTNEGTEVSKRAMDNPMEEFSKISFGPDDVRSLFLDCFLKIEKRDPELKDEPGFKLKPKMRGAINSLLFCFNMLYRKDKFTGEYYRLKDYKLILVRKLPTGNKKPKQDIPDIELQMLCLNPAVTFEKMREARSTIVASGTLSPIQSFASELSTEFKQVLSANHVLGPDRIFATTISSLNGDLTRKLEFSMRHLQTNFDQVQQDLGRILSIICSLIPHGVLFFAPSSDLMRKLKAKWEETGLMHDLDQVKSVFFEHEARRPVEFQQMLETYKKCIDEGKGAILFAILRGRVSEGIDFADNLARAVVTIGIPYLPVFDEAIVAKKDYNNRRVKEAKELGKDECLNGSAWYATDAFRALNQALGRSVRHSKDWGAVIIIDNRFASGKSRSYLPKWVDKSITYWSRGGERSMTNVLPRLQEFLRNIQQEGQ